MEEKIIKKLNTFLKNYKTVKFKKGQLIYSPKDINICLIKDGYTRTYIINKDKQEITLPYIKSLFSSSLSQHLIGKPNQYYFESISPVEIWSVPKNDFLKFIAENPKISEEIVKSMILELSELADNFSKLISSDAYTKIAALICSIAEKTANTSKNEVKINFNIPHRIIASMTGLTRETVTLQILKMQKDGYLKTKGRAIIIRNYKKFQKLSGF